MKPTIPATQTDAWGESIYTVSQVSARLKEYLEANPLLADLTVVGEVANHRNPGSGHHYFTLRDERASLNCVMFRSGRGGRYLQDGAQVVIHGRISVYVARGDVQLYADSVRPAGQGALQQAFEAGQRVILEGEQAFEELKARLDAEGLFDPGRKRPLPEFPGRIAVITSPTGAVIQDILNVLSRRYPLVDMVVIPSAVQGERAAPELVGAFETLDAESDIDLAILARGGGSLEDLWPFNEELVARAIFASRVPVVSAVGHETDFTIADFVADVRAPTPSAAAEMATPDMMELAARVAGAAHAMESRLLRQLRDARTALEQDIDRLEMRVPDTRTPRQQIDSMLRSAGLAVGRILETKRADLHALEVQLAALGPAKILGRGYALVRSPGGSVVTGVEGVVPGDEMSVTFRDGEVDAEAKVIRRNA